MKQVRRGNKERQKKLRTDRREARRTERMKREKWREITTHQKIN